MIEQEMILPLANGSHGLERMARPADMGQVIATIIAITKREWMSQEQTALRPPHPKMGELRSCAAPENSP